MTISTGCVDEFNKNPGMNKNDGINENDDQQRKMTPSTTRVNEINKIVPLCLYFIYVILWGTPNIIKILCQFTPPHPPSCRV